MLSARKIDKMNEEFLLKAIPAPLLLWYRAHKRELAWRSEPTPYHIWVSEIMLQQTRVEAVKEYYARFIKRLPTVTALASCPEEELLKLWEGLGYYSRVRNMQKTAKILVNNYDGELPNDLKSLTALPGIGRYTAGAILSIAYGLPVSAVDGNVLRVINRLTENYTPINDEKYKAWLFDALTKAYPKEKEDCRDFTQSLFELGALVCKPQNPECHDCPMRGLCISAKKGTQKSLPVMPIKKEKREESVYVFVIKTPFGYAISRREQGVLKGMNGFPTYTVTANETPESVIESWGVDGFREIKRRKYKHIFTHIRWDITCVYGEADSVPFDTFTKEEILEKLSLPTAIKQCFSIIE